MIYFCVCCDLWFTSASCCGLLLCFAMVLHLRLAVIFTSAFVVIYLLLRFAVIYFCVLLWFYFRVLLWFASASCCDFTSVFAVVLLLRLLWFTSASLPTQSFPCCTTSLTPRPRFFGTIISTCGPRSRTLTAVQPF